MDPLPPIIRRTPTPPILPTPPSLASQPSVPKSGLLSPATPNPLKKDKIDIEKIPKSNSFATLKQNCLVKWLIPLPGNLLASGSSSIICIWDLSTGNCIKYIYNEQRNLGDGALLSGNLLAYRDDKQVNIYDIAKGVCIKTIQAPAGNRLLALSGNRMAILDLSRIQIWDLSTGEWLRDLYDGNCIATCFIALDNDFIASGSGGPIFERSAEHEIKLWDPNTMFLRFVWNSLTGGSVKQTLRGRKDQKHTGMINDLAKLSHNRLASASQDNTINIWDLSTGECLMILYGDDPAEKLTVLSNNRLACCYRNLRRSSIKIWDLSTQECLKTVYPTVTVNSFASLDGDILVYAAGDDGIITFLKV